MREPYVGLYLYDGDARPLLRMNFSAQMKPYTTGNKNIRVEISNIVYYNYKPIAHNPSELQHHSSGISLSSQMTD
jgi:hypothetical protein